MGYEDIRVKGKIKDSDRCCLCGLLCSIDLFIETRCFHLFCAQCFADYLKRNGHSGEIRNENNYTNLYHPTACPVSGERLQHKHTKGGLYLKMKQYYNLSRYKIRCEFYSFGCQTSVKTTRLNEHYRYCFFTSKLVGNSELPNYHLFLPADYCANNLYGEMKLRVESLNSFQEDENSSLKKYDEKCTGERSVDHLTELKDDQSAKYEQIGHLLKIDGQGSYHLKSTGLLAESCSQNEPTKLLSHCLIAENLKLKNSVINLLIQQDPKDLNELRRHLEILAKNVNFIKDQVRELELRK